MSTTAAVSRRAYYVVECLAPTAHPDNRWIARRIDPGSYETSPKWWFMGREEEAHAVVAWWRSGRTGIPPAVQRAVLARRVAHYEDRRLAAMAAFADAKRAMAHFTREVAQCRAELAALGQDGVTDDAEEDTTR